MSFHIIIPARLHASRFPKKVLARFQDATLLEYTYRLACQSDASQVTIATDHMDVMEEAQRFGASVLMTSDAHQSGTERIIEAIELLGCSDDDVIVNLQADEPCMPVAVLNQLAASMGGLDEPYPMATVATRIRHAEDAMNPNIVKVLLDKNNRAMYFSRAPIPWDRDAGQASQAMRHIGLYAYRAGFLRSYPSEVSPIENIERLEQLRVLWHGYGIHVMETSEAIPAGIDTLQDWQRFQGERTESA